MVSSEPSATSSSASSRRASGPPGSARAARWRCSRASVVLPSARAVRPSASSRAGSTTGTAGVAGACKGLGTRGLAHANARARPAESVHRRRLFTPKCPGLFDIRRYASSRYIPRGVDFLAPRLHERRGLQPRRHKLHRALRALGHHRRVRRALLPEVRRGVEATRRRLHQARQDAHRADRLLDGRDRHREDGRPQGVG